jgi:spermidine synthase
MSDLKQQIVRCSLLGLGAAIVFFLNIQIENQLFVKTNNYADYQVLRNVQFDRFAGSLLNINSAPSSFLTPDKKGFEYIELIKKIIFDDLALANKDILMLGAGGFSISAEKTNGNRFLYVDIDKDLPAVAKKGFIDKINGKFIAEDARTFLLHTKKRFDAVVSDVYSSHYTIPFHLLTKEYFQNIQQVLNPGGVAIFNIIGNPMLHDKYSKRVDNTLRQVFKNCMSVPISYRDGPANIIYICTARPNQDKIIYTDNKNESMIDIYQNR